MADGEAPSVIFGKDRGNGAPVFSYSGADFEIWAYFPIEEQQARIIPLPYRVADSLIKFGTLQTITTSVSSSKTSVDRIGSSTADGYTRGQKTYAGSLIFSVLEKEPLQFLFDQFDRALDANPSYMSFDQLPPFNIMIQGSTEYLSKKDKDALAIGGPQIISKVIVGVELVQHGETISIDDFFLEQSHQYVATYISPWFSGGVNFAEMHTKLKQITSPDNLVPIDNLSKESITRTQDNILNQIQRISNDTVGIIVPIAGNL